MKISNMKFIYALLAMQVLFMIGCLIVSNNAFSESKSSDYINIEEICKPGYGSPCGEVRVVWGNVVIIREEISHSCWAKRNLSLFEKDVISTQENGRIRFSFIDGSEVTLFPMTELQIVRNIIDRAAKERSLFINMRSAGKARFFVSKLDDFESSEAKIKTYTAIVETRGSDFIIEATDTFTKVTALKDTWLEVISLAAPEMDPILISEYEQVFVKEGALPSEVAKLIQEEIEMMLEEFNIDKLEKETSMPAGKIVYEGVFFSKDELVEPEGLVKPGEEELEWFEFIEQIDESLASNEMSFEEIQEDNEDIFEENLEDEEEENLPQFPRHP